MFMNRLLGFLLAVSIPFTALAGGTAGGGSGFLSKIDELLILLKQIELVSISDQEFNKALQDVKDDDLNGLLIDIKGRVFELREKVLPGYYGAQDIDTLKSVLIRVYLEKSP